MHQPRSSEQIPRDRIRLRHRVRGQALVEFAVILPILLTMFGAAVDVARVYQKWNVLESATRDAAEYAATNDATMDAAKTDAARIVCTETTGLPSCPGPTPIVSSPFTPGPTSTSAPGASTTYPIGSVTVITSLPFQTLFPYPLFTQGGVWTLRSTQSYTIVQGRQ